MKVTFEEFEAEMQRAIQFVKDHWDEIEDIEYRRDSFPDIPKIGEEPYLRSISTRTITIRSIEKQ